MRKWLQFSFEAQPISSQHFLILAVGFVWSSNTGGGTVFRVALMNLTFRMHFYANGSGEEK